MKRRQLSKGTAVAVLAGALSFALLSWDFKKPGSVYIDDETCDTIPVNREKKIRDLDDVLREMDDVQFKLNKELKLDLEKMQIELELSLKQIDLEKMKREIELSFSKIDMDKMKAEIEKSLKEVDFDKIKKEIDASMASIDWDKMKMELDRAKDIDFSMVEKEMKKVQEEMKKIGPEIELSLQKAKVEIEKAKVELKEYNKFVDQLEKDGLLKRADGYTLKHKDGEFFINGKKQSQEVYNKYRSFLDKHKSFNITKGDDDFDIDLD